MKNATIFSLSRHFQSINVFNFEVITVYRLSKPLILLRFSLNPIRTLAPDSRNPNLVPIGNGFGFLLYLDYPNLNNKKIF